MKIPWYEKLNDIVSPYGIVPMVSHYGIASMNTSCLEVLQSYTFNGLWIFDHYLENDFAFMKYDEEKNCLMLETMTQYNYFSFIKTLKKTMEDIKTYQLNCKLNQIKEDFN